MTMWISQSDVENSVYLAALSVALKLKIPDADLLPPADLRAEIQKSSSVAHDALAAFSAAYHAWLEFHKKVEGEGSSGQLTSEQTSEQVRLVSQLESSREHIIQTVRKLR
jgi:hypothetical protein